jgi:signal transduction histidine kinase
MWTAGPDGRRVDAGQDAAAAQQPASKALVHPEDVERCGETLRRALERRESFQLEYRVRDAGGAERWMLDTGLVRFSGQTFDGYVGSTVDITRLGRARAELSSLSRHLIREHERERAALARTLLDDVGQRMAALTLRLHSLSGVTPDAEVVEIRETLSNLVEEIARLTDPAYAQLELLGLAMAGRRFCVRLSARHNLAIHFQDDGVPRDLPADIALALFRVLQESTINAAVHSRAREVWVSMRGADDELRLHVVDRGVGFDAQHTVPGAGVGLVAIRERLKLVNGDSRIVSARGAGTRVEAWVPLPPEA